MLQVKVSLFSSFLLLLLLFANSLLTRLSAFGGKNKKVKRKREKSWPQRNTIREREPWSSGYGRRLAF